MRTRRRLAAVLALLLAGCAGSPSAPSSAPSPVQPSPSPSPPRPRVVIVSIDGLRPDALLRVESPNIRALAAQGAYTWQAQTIVPSNTLPSHVSMLSGYTPTIHKVTWDQYRPDSRITVPTLFSAARAAGLITAMVVGKDKFNYFQDTGSVGAYRLTAKGDDDVANMALVEAQTGFDLLFVHFPDVDLTGHAMQWMSTTYLDRITIVDRAVGRLLAGLPVATTVILTSDHGGHGSDHAAGEAMDLTIPWIISGPNTLKGQVLTTRVNTTDTAATAAYVLGLSLPPDVQGKPVLEAFSRSN